MESNYPTVLINIWHINLEPNENEEYTDKDPQTVHTSIENPTLTIPVSEQALSQYGN